MIRLTDELALVQTLDFFTPIVDDPFDFGRIAAANALSDVWAMGGDPLCAMNIVAFPAEEMEIEVLQEVLRGGLATLSRAGTALVGGHSVSDAELKYGLSVSGTVHPERVLANRGARPGDRLALTKPLGTGIVNTAIKAELASPRAIESVVRTMSALNREASEVARRHRVHACTDVTGFGLVGHVCEMIQGSGVGVRVRAESLPRLPEVREHAEMGLLPAGLHRNREHWRRVFGAAKGVEQHEIDMVWDPQTSGGLLLAAAPGEIAAIVEELRAAAVEAVEIGEVVSDPGERFELL